MDFAGKTVASKNGVSKQVFEKAYVELSDRVRLIDQKLATKADEVVLTLALSHRQEIEELQEEIVKLRKEIKQLKSKKEEQKLNRYVGKKTSFWRYMFKKMQFARK
ncbi:hypothetical protein ERJ70_10110 [Sediminibacillus dalangtanensis]|uniref:Cell division protein ZapA n=1 Tax=Sediminibacillus dalangtanensis TaxID=2729421 RepID=A0ABX7VRR9_9BACI|nr:hypothetical protein [Sediminibacillus dalangtanensis]QTM99621.1 hypothetical protein ERJ70_10110 [Sediminibacillus dalangtanensis]